MTPEDERAAQLLRDDREITRRERRRFLTASGGSFLCCGVGLALVGWALHTTDQRWAGVAFWSGLLIGDSGTVWLLLWYFASREGLDL